MGAVPPGRPSQWAKLLCFQKGRRGTAGQKNSWPSSGTHTPGGVPGRSLGYISPLFHSGVFSHLSRFLCAQAARPPLSLSQRKWAKKRSRGNPLPYTSIWKLSSLRCRKLAQKGRDGEYSPLGEPPPVFLGKLLGNAKASPTKSFVNLFKGCRVSGQRPDSRSAERETPFCP